MSELTWITSCLGESGKVYWGQREKLTESELKRKILESWQEIVIDDVRKCISAW